MGKLRRIATVGFAILFASPLCCCASHAAPKSEMPKHACCSLGEGGSRTPAPAPDCPCKAENPRIADRGKTFDFAVVLPELAPLAIFSAVPSIRNNDLAPDIDPIPPHPRPPRHMLVLRQSFLI